MEWWTVPGIDTNYICRAVLGRKHGLGIKFRQELERMLTWSFDMFIYNL